MQDKIFTVFHCAIKNNLILLLSYDASPLACLEGKVLVNDKINFRIGSNRLQMASRGARSFHTITVCVACVINSSIFHK